MAQRDGRILAARSTRGEGRVHQDERRRNVVTEKIVDELAVMARHPGLREACLKDRGSERVDLIGMD
jgi:hypothetical protein